jgi:glyoxylase-like metal-dependent hydrolase (beta-lactamase superfamily II)
LLLDECDNLVAVELSDVRATTEMSLERGDVAVVGANRVRRQVFGDEKPADVLLACLAHLHTDHLSSLVIRRGFALAAYAHARDAARNALLHST